MSLEDEYESEIREIREKILKEVKNINKKKIFEILKQVFINSFPLEYIFDEKIGKDIANKIFFITDSYKFDNFSLRDCRENKDFNIEDIEKFYMIKKIINKWDSIEIMGFSFENEYCYEIGKIMLCIKEKNNIQNLELKIKEIFSKSYGNLYHSVYKDEKRVANKILNCIT